MVARYVNQTFQAERLDLYYGGMEDLESIMDVMQNSFVQTYGEAWNQHQCRSMLMMPNARLLIAEYSDQVCGFVISRHAAGEEEILMVAVKQEMQGKSIGKQLLDQAIATAREDECKAIFLEVRDGNKALNLYNRMGFFKIGIRKAYYSGHNKEKFDAITLKMIL